MPALGSHLARARMIADRLGHGWIEADRGAYYLGATAPDSRTMSRVDRAHTHFYTLDEFAAQDPVARMFAAHPELAAHDDPETRAFVAGYITHLLMDQHYIERVYREFFGARSKLRDDPRADLLDRLLQYELERREREDGESMAAIRAALDANSASAAVAFIEADTLRRWREVAQDAASYPATWERWPRVAGRHTGRGAESDDAAAELLRETPALLREVIDHVTEERVQQFMEESLDETTARLREYLQ